MNWRCGFVKNKVWKRIIFEKGTTVFFLKVFLFPCKHQDDFSFLIQFIFVKHDYKARHNLWMWWPHYILFVFRFYMHLAFSMNNPDLTGTIMWIYWLKTSKVRLLSIIGNAWKVPKYGVFSGPYFPIFRQNTTKCGPGKSQYLGTFNAVVRVIWNSQRTHRIHKICRKIRGYVAFTEILCKMFI